MCVLRNNFTDINLCNWYTFLQTLLHCNISMSLFINIMISFYYTHFKDVSSLCYCIHMLHLSKLIVMAIYKHVYWESLLCAKCAYVEEPMYWRTRLIHLVGLHIPRVCNTLKGGLSLKIKRIYIHLYFIAIEYLWNKYALVEDIDNWTRSHTLIIIYKIVKHNI